MAGYCSKGFLPFCVQYIIDRNGDLDIFLCIVQNKIGYKITDRGQAIVFICGRFIKRSSIETRLTGIGDSPVSTIGASGNFALGFFYRTAMGIINIKVKKRYSAAW
jgi:hypothetical protein